MKKFFKNNGLSISFLLMFVFSLIGQAVTGMKEYNKELKEYHQPAVSFGDYLHSGHFVQATFENWESEFLQMALFVILTIFLFEKGSSESKKIDEENEVDRDPDPMKKDAPWPVRRGGWILAVYKHSLSIALLLLFFLSFAAHFEGSLRSTNKEHTIKGEALEKGIDYLAGSRFWFESFQNWQSEFLSVFAIVALSIYLRQKGSPQSKPVDASHAETGE
ncbi:MAG: hypothetical protein JWQ27_1557 [Ferruginibacter sp.]|nr:hypothetical protein [Ferruginibacter sp.]